MRRPSPPAAALLRVLFGLAALALSPVGPASGEIWVITLHNDAAFESRYQPVADAGRLLFLTDMGNWIALDRAQVREIRPLTEIRGFGRVIATETIEVGLTANDRPETGSEPDIESDAESGIGPGSGAADPDRERRDELRALLERFERRPYSVDQFVEPEQAAGIPLTYSLGALPPVGSPQRFLTPQDRP